jgi:hypothetical protein
MPVSKKPDINDPVTSAIRTMAVRGALTTPPIKALIEIITIVL